MPERIRLQRVKGWQLPRGAVWASRPSKWGNPFTIGKPSPDEYHMRPVTSGIVAVDAAHAVALYEHWARHVAGPGYLAAARTELPGKDLACWCPPDQPCHTAVLLEYANHGTSHKVTIREPLCKQPGCAVVQYHRGLCVFHYTDDTATGRAAAARANLKQGGRVPLPPDQVNKRTRWVDLARLAATTPTEGWEKRGACHGMDGHERIELFYASLVTDVDKARRFCRDPDGPRVCPVIYDCLAHALATGEGHGVWGGCSENERTRITRVLTIRRRRAA